MPTQIRTSTSSFSCPRGTDKLAMFLSIPTLQGERKLFNILYNTTTTTNACVHKNRHTLFYIFITCNILLHSGVLSGQEGVV